jgi:CRP-like cAMP-binding protein
MAGVVEAYINLKNGEELVTDYLGIGSIVGQYSVFEKEYSMFGYRVASVDGLLMIELSKDDLFKLTETNEQIRLIKTEAEHEINKNGINPVDFVIYNDLWSD